MCSFETPGMRWLRLATARDLAAGIARATVLRWRSQCLSPFRYLRNVHQDPNEIAFATVGKDIADALVLASNARSLVT
jgi:hypothetical protein